MVLVRVVLAAPVVTVPTLLLWPPKVALVVTVVLVVLATALLTVALVALVALARLAEPTAARAVMALMHRPMEMALLALLVEPVV